MATQPSSPDALRKTVVVTGDVVLDRHLYCGSIDRASSFRKPGVIFRQRLGGAALTRDVLAHALISFEERIKQRDAEEPSQQGARPVVSFELINGFDAKALEIHVPEKRLPEYRLPEFLTSYGVWEPFPASKGAREQVWRVERNFGFGIPNAETDNLEYGAIAKSFQIPDLVVLDDGGLLFRQERSHSAWPSFVAGDAAPLLILKTKAPLARGALWSALTPIMNRVIVVLQADDLRRHDIQISERVSWEQCVENTIAALHGDPSVMALTQAAVLVINFRSAGALIVVPDGSGSLQARLLFDPLSLEGDHANGYSGTVYGSQSCLVAGIVHQLVADHCARGASGPVRPARPVLERGIASGLQAMRRLLELGHGTVDPFTEPAVPLRAIGQVIDTPAGGFVGVDVPVAAGSLEPKWSILSSTYMRESNGARIATHRGPRLAALAMLTARFGTDALCTVPSYRIGKLFSIDRFEIESLRALERLICAYEQRKIQPRPLCIGVFGPPGSGKSFGIKAIARGVLGNHVPLLEFNLSQFRETGELIGAFHSVRDAVLRGVTPVVFWDEFDSHLYKWLQYLLAPMQDGAFQQGDVTHPIGKCIFVFAGGTSASRAKFGPPEPKTNGQTLPEQGGDDMANAAWNQYKLLKGPDFVSRLHGHLDVLSINAKTNPTDDDTTWPVRRALVLRSTLGRTDSVELDIDAGLLYALLAVPKFLHGTRSLEKIAVALEQGAREGHLHRSALLPDDVLSLETDVAALHRLIAERMPFKNPPDLEELAAAIHASFLEAGEKSQTDAAKHHEPGKAWRIDPSVMKEFEKLGEGLKQANRAAAARIAEHLALIDFAITPVAPGSDDGWKRTLEHVLEDNIDLLAQAEHLGWCSERAAQGWRFGAERNNNKRRHPLMTPWNNLSESDRDKDRTSIRKIPVLLEGIGLTAERVGP